MILVWSMAVLGVVFMFILASVRAAEQRRLHALRVELEKEGGGPRTGLRVRPVTNAHARPTPGADPQR
jgi:hypothetical protein